VDDPPEQRPIAIRGRGAASNPPNRFERLARIDDEPDAPSTELYRDTSRTIIATNDSPDVGFAASINPYRGCEHGCAYCLEGRTPVLLAGGTTRSIAELRPGDEIYGTMRVGWYRRYVRTKVLAHWSTTKPAYKVTLDDGTELIASGDHRFLTERGWKHVTPSDVPRMQRPHLTVNNSLMGVGSFTDPPIENADYRRGYLSGMIRGDAYLAAYFRKREGRSHGNQYQFRLALVDLEALQRSQRYLADYDVETRAFVFQRAVGARKEVSAIRTSARSSVFRIDDLIAWPVGPSDSWCKGFLAGIYDAEGSYSGGCLRIANTNEAIVDRIKECLDRLSFGHVVDAQESRDPLVYIRVRGGLKDHLRFFHTVGTAISRKRDIEGQAVKSSARLGVRAIEKVSDAMTLFDITTGTGDFIANGVVSHNCYARPTHEYLGFSAGLDFETKIFVKEDAAALLRRELADPRWRPQTLSISGVTDPYQPVERRLQITRQCLEVLVEFRNPVCFVTKSHLITRDADLIGELARFDAAAAILSITTLDRDLARRLEPRAATPDLRLDALRCLSEAGVPTGVMVAPIIPGLTDHEVPAILAAAADAGARVAGYTIVRLPLAVAPLFEAWLDEHAPGRKQKVLNRLRAMRGGRLNDPRMGKRMRGAGAFAVQIDQLFRLGLKRAGLSTDFPSLSTEHFRRPGQLALFE
jgi:DNA repair photolyase